MHIESRVAAVGAVNRRVLAPWIAAGAIAALLAVPARGQDGPTEVTGRAILSHAAGVAVVEAAELLKAGKLAEVKQASLREVREEWAATSPVDQQELAEMARERAPEPGALEAGIAENGLLTIYGDSATLNVASADGNSTVMAFVSLEEGTWRVTAGPMTVDTSPVEETAPQLQGAEVLEHEIGKVVLAYARAVAAGELDRAMELATVDARSKRLADDAEERRASDDYRRSTTPGATDLADQIRDGGRISFEGERAYLFVITSTRAENPDGSVTFSTSSLSIPFALEDGAWRVAD